MLLRRVGQQVRRSLISHAKFRPKNTRGFLQLLGKSSMPRIPLTHPFGNTNIHKNLDPNAPSHETTISTLKNGLRVATHASASPITNLGVFIDSGSRYETRENNGISHFIEQMSFKSTQGLTDFRIVRDMAKIGANVMSSTSRELTIYTGEVLPEFAPHVLTLFAEIVQNHKFDPHEVEERRGKYEEELKDRMQLAGFETEVMESIHAAAYFNNTLGRSIYAPIENLHSFTSETLKERSKTWNTPARMVIAGVGIDHAELVKLVEANFTNLGPELNIPKEKAVYTGGEVRMHRPNMPDSHQEPLSHFVLAFETASWNDSDLVPMCVLQMLMGGGGSFSAGGPGKGMYSRLYENVLNNYGWARSATCFNSVFSDSSIFGIYGTCGPEYAEELAAVVVDEALKMAGPMKDGELRRAKNQLKSAVFMQLESRNLLLEDIGRQVIVYNKVRSPYEIAEQIDRVTQEDVIRVAQKMLKTTPSVVTAGDLSTMPRYDIICQKFV